MLEIRAPCVLSSTLPTHVLLVAPRCWRIILFAVACGLLARCLAARLVPACSSYFFGRADISIAMFVRFLLSKCVTRAAFIGVVFGGGPPNEAAAEGRVRRGAQ